MELTKIARVVNDIYGIQILLTTTTCFMIIISLLYVCYMIIGHSQRPREFLMDVAPVAGWIFFCTLKFCALSYSCVIASSTVNHLL